MKHDKLIFIFYFYFFINHVEILHDFFWHHHATSKTTGTYSPHRNFHNVIAIPRIEI